MVREVTRDQAEDVKQFVQDQLVDEEWVKDIYLDSDDCGWCVTVKVDRVRYRLSKSNVPQEVYDVRVTTMMVG